MYTDIPREVTKAIGEECKKLNTKRCLVSRVSLGVNDAHLFVVLASKNKPLFVGREYVAWYFNTYSNSLFDGKYELTFKEALDVINSRIHI